LQIKVKISVLSQLIHYYLYLDLSGIIGGGPGGGRGGGIGRYCCGGQVWIGAEITATFLTFIMVNKIYFSMHFYLCYFGTFNKGSLIAKHLTKSFLKATLIQNFVLIVIVRTETLAWELLLNN
jgi:hypothetical protein